VGCTGNESIVWMVGAYSETISLKELVNQRN
jgi:hypothetical protein